MRTGVFLSIVLTPFALCFAIYSPFPWCADNKGIGSEASYPYTATDGTCKTVPSVVTIKSFTDVQTGSEQQLMAAVAQQPISVAVEADQDSFQLYAGGCPLLSR